MKDVTNLRPFKRFCMTIGNIPSAYIESLSYAELLYWFCDYIENTVIPTVNNNADCVTELQNLFVNLQTFVDNYFDNLDVQEEINNKLDKMTLEGYFQNILENYAQNYYNSLQHQIDSLSSGSPLVASSVNEMTNTSRVYVNTTDGKWYYYNGTSWVAGGTYQSTEIANKSITPNKTSFMRLNKEGNLIEVDKAVKTDYFIDNINGNHVYYNGVRKLDFLASELENSSYSVDFDGSLVFYNSNNEIVKVQMLSSLSLQNWSTVQFPTTYERLEVYILYSSHLNNGVFSKTSNRAHGLKTTYFIDILKVDFSQLQNVLISDSNVNDKTLSISKLKNAQLNDSSNLLELSKAVRTDYFIDNTNGNHVSYNGVRRFDFSSSELDNSTSYSIDADSYIVYYDSNNTILSVQNCNSLVLQNWAELQFPENFDHLEIYIIYSSHLNNAVFCKTMFRTHGLKSSYFINDLSLSNIDFASVSNLKNKKAIFFGDSWTAGNTQAPGSWCNWLHEKINTFIAQNCGRHGADWAQGYSYWFSGSQDNIVNADYDFVIIQAYTNGLYGNVSNLSKQLGTIDEFNFYNSISEMQTALGNTYAFDLERFLYTIVNKYAGKKIGLMFPYKSVAMKNQNNAFRVFREQVIKCCNKYNIAIFDNFNGCNIPSFTQEQIDQFYFKDTGANHADGVHLNSNGIDLIGNKILQWLNSL